MCNLLYNKQITEAWRTSEIVIRDYDYLGKQQASDILDHLSNRLSSQLRHSLKSWLTCIKAVAKVLLTLIILLVLFVASLLHLCFVISFAYRRILKKFKTELKRRNWLHLPHLCVLSHFCSNYIFDQTYFSLTLQTCICLLLFTTDSGLSKRVLMIFFPFNFLFIWRTTIQTR